MFINNIACNLLDGPRHQQQRAGHEAFVLLSAFGAGLAELAELTEEEVDDEPPQSRHPYLALSQPQQGQWAYAL
jgi:hypothetical protein